MKNTIIKKIQASNFIDAGKQIKTSLSENVLEQLAIKKSEIMESFGDLDEDIKNAHGALMYRAKKHDTLKGGKGDAAHIRKAARLLRTGKHKELKKHIKPDTNINSHIEADIYKHASEIVEK